MQGVTLRDAVQVALQLFNCGTDDKIQPYRYDDLSGLVIDARKLPNHRRAIA